MKIIIIGGGVGGLGAAIALQRVGLSVDVYEQAPQFAEVGAGLGVLSNAVRALEALGVDGGVRAEGFPLATGQFCTDSGRILKSIDFNMALDPHYPSYIAHRADLLRWLLDAVPAESLHPGHRCTAIDTSRADAPGGKVLVTFDNGAQVEADAVIGADGFRSVIRTALWGAQPQRYSGQVCYRGVCRYSLKEPHVIREIQGKGQRASPIALARDRVYWWAALNAPVGTSAADPVVTRRERLMARYKDWPFEVPEVIAATPAEAILCNDLVDIAPIPHWTKGRVTLLGDAAHPMQPNLGQGACSSIEDAVVLGRHLAAWRNNPPRTAADVSATFQAYEAERKPRTTRLVNESWQFGIPCLWSSPIAVFARNTLMALMPTSMLIKSFGRNMNYDAGKLPAI
ncbi:MAG: FAD-dependent monooxygenase [Candidatus Methylacidiphilales bacterium]|nr:FAD-dependent monooxygenase [Candidatus Methylacidiphilales bacterium]